MRRVRPLMRPHLLALPLLAFLAACATSAPTKPAAPEIASGPVDAASVLAVVRTEASLAGLRQPLARPLGGGLDLVCIAGRGDSARVLTDADLAALGLDREGAVALALANAAAGMRPLSETIQPQPPGAVGRVDGDLAAASHVLLHDEWARTASAMGGKLLVAVPSADLVLYADGEAPGAAQMLASAARAAMAQSAQPISDAVLRWSRQGWETEIAATPSASAPARGS